LIGKAGPDTDVRKQPRRFPFGPEPPSFACWPAALPAYYHLPGMLESELADTITDAGRRRRWRVSGQHHILDAIACAILFVTKQPAEVSVSEIIVRPSGKDGIANPPNRSPTLRAPVRNAEATCSHRTNRPVQQTLSVLRFHRPNALSFQQKSHRCLPEMDTNAPKPLLPKVLRFHRPEHARNAYAGVGRRSIETYLRLIGIPGVVEASLNPAYCFWQCSMRKHN